MSSVAHPDAAFLAEFGITRLADLTRLDRVGMPTYAALVPASDDELSVFAGSGMTAAQARAAAIGEAVERQSACRFAPRTLFLSARELEQFWDLGGLTYVGHLDEPIECCEGVDRSGAIVPVPLERVRCNPAHPRRFLSSTNGLACGRGVGDAQERALLELMERHLTSLLVARSEIAPFLMARAAGREEAPQDWPVAAEVRRPAPPAIEALLERAERAGVTARVFIHYEPGFPPLGYAAVWERTAGGVMGGRACRTSPHDAGLAALVEALQGRLINIAAARDDITPEGATGNPHARQAAPRPGAWYYDLAAPSAVDCAEAPSVAVDEAAIPGRLVTVAIRSNSESAVVRCVADSMESYEIDRRLGPAMRYVLENPWTTLPLPAR